MIEKEYSKYNIVCDGCGKMCPGFDTFQDALDYAKEYGWSYKTERRPGAEWENYCEDCNE